MSDDLDRLIAAAVARNGGTPQVRAGWENFKAQLHIHHTVEDSELWPRLRSVVSRPSDVALVDQMEAEHAQLDPLLDTVDEALAGPADDLADHARALSSALCDHLTHEEASALPLVQSELTPADWRAFAGQMRRRQGIRGAAVYVPWIIDGWPRDQQHRFLTKLPPPVRLINRLAWERRHRRRHLWNV